MSKILEATCVGGVVTSENIPVPGVTILSEGVSESSGVLILDEEKKTYLAKTSPDLKTALELIISALSAIDGNGYIISSGPDVPGGPQASGTISTLTALKDALK